MDLYFYTGRLDLAVTTLADLQLLIAALADEADPDNAATIARVTGKVQPFVQSDSGEPLNLYWYDDASGTVASWVTDSSVTLAIGLGLPDPQTASLYSSTTTTAISGSKRTATLALNTTALQSALSSQVSGLRSRSSCFTLHLRKTASGVSETVGLLPVEVRPGVLTATPVDDSTSAAVDTDTLNLSAVLNKSALTSLTGGGASALDGLPTATGTTGRLPVGCVVLTALNDLPQHWKLKSGTTAEDGLTVIRPDDYAATTNEVYWQLLA